MSDWVELTALWKQGGGDYRSVELADDRVAELVSRMSEGPVRLYLKLTTIKRNPKSPDAVLLIVPARKLYNPASCSQF